MNSPNSPAAGKSRASSSSTIHARTRSSSRRAASSSSNHPTASEPSPAGPSGTSGLGPAIPQSVPRRSASPVGDRSGTDDADAPASKKRCRATPAQVEQLEALFAQEPTPKVPRRNEIAAQLGMTERQTQIWYQNRRSKQGVIEGRIPRRRRSSAREASPPGGADAGSAPNSPPDLTARLPPKEAQASPGSSHRTPTACSSGQVQSSIPGRRSSMGPPATTPTPRSSSGFRRVPLSQVHLLHPEAPGVHGQSPTPPRASPLSPMSPTSPLSPLPPSFSRRLEERRDATPRTQASGSSDVGPSQAGPSISRMRPTHTPLGYYTQLEERTAKAKEKEAAQGEEVAHRPPREEDHSSQWEEDFQKKFGKPEPGKKQPPPLRAPVHVPTSVMPSSAGYPQRVDADPRQAPLYMTKRRTRENTPGGAYRAPSHAHSMPSGQYRLPSTAHRSSRMEPSLDDDIEPPASSSASTSALHRAHLPNFTPRVLIGPGVPPPPRRSSQAQAPTESGPMSASGSGHAHAYAPPANLHHSDRRPSMPFSSPTHTPSYGAYSQELAYSTSQQHIGHTLSQPAHSDYRPSDQSVHHAPSTPHDLAPIQAPSFDHILPAYGGGAQPSHRHHYPIPPPAQSLDAVYDPTYSSQLPNPHNSPYQPEPFDYATEPHDYNQSQHQPTTYSTSHADPNIQMQQQQQTTEPVYPPDTQYHPQHPQAQLEAAIYRPNPDGQHTLTYPTSEESALDPTGPAIMSPVLHYYDASQGYPPATHPTSQMYPTADYSATGDGQLTSANDAYSQVYHPAPPQSTVAYEDAGPNAYPTMSAPQPQQGYQAQYRHPHADSS